MGMWHKSPKVQGPADENEQVRAGSKQEQEQEQVYQQMQWNKKCCLQGILDIMGMGVGMVMGICTSLRGCSSHPAAKVHIIHEASQSI
jgi:hypothetical protein